MSKITDLQFQKKNKNRVNIFVDDVFFAGASLEAVMKFGLKQGIEINEDELSEFLFINESQKAITLATDLISRFVKTESQMKTYLKSKGFTDRVILNTISKLKEYGLIDDNQFVEAFVNFKKNVCGINKIKQELYKKGIDKNLIDNVNFLISDTQDVCFNVAQKYMANKDVTKLNGIKLNRYLLSKGFDFADINDVIKKIMKEGGDDESWD